jgi:hypothetical protein
MIAQGVNDQINPMMNQQINQMGSFNPMNESIPILGQ